jgi:hypothetical protein
VVFVSIVVLERLFIHVVWYPWTWSVITFWSLREMLEQVLVG